MSPAPKVVEPGGGELIEHAGWQAVIVLDGDATGGALPRHRRITREEFHELRRRCGIDTLEEA